MSDAAGRGEAAALRLRALADELLAEAHGVPHRVLVWQPANDVWSVMDILCHVQEFVPYWTEQVTQIVTHPDRTWGRIHTDAGRLAAVANTAAKALVSVEQAIRAAVSESAAVIGQLSDADLEVEAASRNPRWGVKPAGFIVDHLLVQHVEKHLGQIRRNVLQHSQGEHMSQPLFAVPPPVLAAIRGRSERFPIRRIFCVGRNYEAHAREMGAAVDREEPFYFTKFAESYVPSGSTVPYPPGTNNYHYEVELVAAIGSPGFRIPEAQALDHVFGYACGLDMTRRDLQSAAKDQRRPWDLGKNVEQSAILGDIAPAQAIGHPGTGRIELRVNGQTKQSSDLGLLIHSVAAVVSHLSRYYHLQAGDLIYTGTPEGVGPVVAGDRLEGSIDGVGTIALELGQAEVAP